VKGPRDPATIVSNSAFVSWSGHVWRCHHRSRAALNTDGSLAGIGGRFNAGVDNESAPAFPALYTSIESAAALLEVVRHLGYREADSRAVVALDDIAMRVLSQLDVSVQRAFDWSGRAELASGASYADSQQLAAAAFQAGAEAILVPSATGIDRNLIIFLDNLLDGCHVNLLRQITDLRPIISSLAGGD
jgi:RES domain-containing protein